MKVQYLIISLVFFIWDNVVSQDNSNLSFLKSNDYCNSSNYNSQITTLIPHQNGLIYSQNENFHSGSGIYWIEPEGYTLKLHESPFWHLNQSYRKDSSGSLDLFLFRMIDYDIPAFNMVQFNHDGTEYSTEDIKSLDFKTDFSHCAFSTDLFFCLAEFEGSDYPLISESNRDIIHLIKSLYNDHLLTDQSGNIFLYNNQELFLINRNNERVIKIDTFTVDHRESVILFKDVYQLHFKKNKLDIYSLDTSKVGFSIKNDSRDLPFDNRNIQNYHTNDHEIILLIDNYGSSQRKQEIWRVDSLWNISNISPPNLDRFSISSIAKSDDIYILGLNDRSFFNRSIITTTKEIEDSIQINHNKFLTIDNATFEAISQREGTYANITMKFSISNLGIDTVHSFNLYSTDYFNPIGPTYSFFSHLFEGSIAPNETIELTLTDSAFRYKDFHDEISFFIPGVDYEPNSIGTDFTLRDLIVSDKNITDTNISYTYPNPSNHTFTIRSELTDNILYYVYDLNGRSISTGAFKNEISLSSDSWAPGLYMIKLNTAKGSQILKHFKL